MELATEGAYNQVSFSYDGNGGDNSLSNEAADESDVADFKLPPKLVIPENVPLVSN